MINDQDKIEIYGGVIGQRTGNKLILSWNRPNSKEEIAYLNFEQYYDIKKYDDELYTFPIFHLINNISDFVFIDKKYCLIYEENFNKKLEKELGL